MTRDEEFTAFFEATWSRLYRTTYGVAGSAALAEDALQSAYAKAYLAWDRVTAADNPFAYVRAIAINEVLGVRRRPWFRRESVTASIEERHDTAAVEPPSHDDDVWRAVMALPPGQRAVIVLRYYEGLREAQIAEVLGCRPGTVKSQASAALSRLRPHLAELMGLDARPSGPAPTGTLENGTSR